MEAEKIIETINDIEKQSMQDMSIVQAEEELEIWRVKYLGRKGKLSEVTEFLPGLPVHLKPEAGKKINILKKTLLTLYEKQKKGVTDDKNVTKINLSFPGMKQKTGLFHPLTVTTREMVDIFRKMGFGVVTGPEIETDYYNFGALNTPDDHPAKDMWDTFYLDEKNKILLRTHTSPVQIRVMEKTKPPFRIIAIGKCFRRDALDASHSPVFNQMEGLMVEKGIKFSDLKGVLIYFLQQVFGKEVKVKFTPSYFPFTEPSAEVSISCIICKGKGCSTCGQSGWLEILGSGMVHPQVLKNVGYDTEKVTGFAFGMGIERIAMLKYGIKDIRYFYQNDIRFIEQFG